MREQIFACKVKNIANDKTEIIFVSLEDAILKTDVMSLLRGGCSDLNEI